MSDGEINPNIEFNDATLLLVDDNEDDVFIMRSALKRAGVNNPLQTVQNGEEAVAYLSGAGSFADRVRFPLPVVVFLDLNMPKKNGLEVLAWIRQQPRLKNQIVHILTASTRPVDVEQAFQSGANAYFIKPSRLEGLLELLRCWHTLAQYSAFPRAARPSDPL